MNIDQIKIAVVGLGYVGLPLAVAFGRQRPVLGFDINEKRITDLRLGIDKTNEVTAADLQAAQIEFTIDPQKLRQCNFIIVAVPTPVDEAKRPDLRAVEAAARTVGENIQIGAIVVFESTVYPGVTEDVCGPIIASGSGLRLGIDFKLGYSPERINPGDKEHTIDKVVKIVSGQDGETLEAVAGVYSLVCLAGVHRAPSIKTAEAAKVIENIQRDLNIALVNELAILFHKIGLNTRDVLNAAGTKWNFHRYHPGLVGGHCIGVDPYYLTYLAEKLNHHPEVILAGRRINDFMPEYVAEMVIRGLINAGKVVQNAKVLILGLTFKENVNDVRNSKIKEVIKRLKECQINVLAHDPLLSADEMEGFGVQSVSDLTSLPLLDGVVLGTAHDQLKKMTLDDIRRMMAGRAVLVDVPGIFNNTTTRAQDLIYHCL